MSDRRFRIDPPTYTPPVDPWPSAPTVPGFAHDGRTRSFPAVDPDEITEPVPVRRSGKRGQLFGYVYELVLIGQPDAVCEYIGKTEQTMAERMSTSGSGHRSPTSIARDPWKGRIKQGAAGYRILERVRCTGEGYDADRLALLRAESDWIDRRRPLRNDVRPVRPRGAATPARRERPTETRTEQRRAAPVRRAAAPTAAQLRRRRRQRWRALGWLLMTTLVVALVARLIVAMALPWAGAPFAALPIGATLGTLFFLRLDKLARRIKGR